MSSSDPRSKEELLVIRSIQGFLLIVRLFAIVFFCIFSARHIKFGLTNKGLTQSDLLSSGIFICLGISFLGFFIYRGLEIGV